jgi:hypothetical protein
VLYDFNVLHDPRIRKRLQEVWSSKHLFTRRFWRRLIADYFSESKYNEFDELVAVRSYFGLKIAFYFGFLGFYTNQLLAPAAAGVFAFLLQFVPSRYESDVKDSSEDAARFDDQYDHPLLFVYGAFLCVWIAYMVQVRELSLSCQGRAAFAPSRNVRNEGAGLDEPYRWCGWCTCRHRDGRRSSTSWRSGGMWTTIQRFHDPTRCPPPP